MKALITAGGRGTRLRPLTFTTNKHLLPIANKPMIFYAIEKVRDAGITDIGIIINDGDNELPPAIGDGSRWNAKITYIPQVGGALGLAHAVGAARDFIGEESFLFYLGDNIILADLSPFIERFHSENLSALLAFSKVKDPHRFGVPEFDGDRLVRVIEKPQIPPSDFAVTGIYIYNSDVFQAVDSIKPSARGELEISDAHTWLLENDRPVGWEPITGWWKDTGKPEDLLDCNQFVLDRLGFAETDKNASIPASAIIKGRVSIGKNSRIGDNVYIQGPAVIGDNASIENAYIGAYTSIGSNTVIKGTNIQNSIVFDGANINTDSVISDSLIGYNARITSAKDTLPKGHRLFVGDNSFIEL